MYEDIENGAEFYFSEEDYLSPEELSGAPQKRRPTKRKHTRIRVRIVSEYTVKTESSPGPSLAITPPPASAPVASSSSTSASGSGMGGELLEVKRRSRRSVATASKSYVVPDSDDEEIADDGDELMVHVHAQAKKRRVESNLQKWIKHLSALLKEEQKKVSNWAVGLCCYRS